VSLFGEWNWYLPQSVARVLRIKEPDYLLELPRDLVPEATAV
jgi:hypothetical protein